MRQPESDGQHGFILHDVCWRLLLKAGEPLGVPILRLVLVCESLAFPLGFEGVYWGHSYGELLELDDDRAYPWQEWSVHRRGQSIYNIDAYENPLVIPELHAILCHPARPPAGEALARGSDDIFSKLPWELRLRNRQRIWDFAGLLIEIARQQYANDDLHLEGQHSESENWIRLAGDEKHRDADDQWSLFDGGCRSISNVIIDVPKDLRGLGITTVSLGPLDYVAGIRLIAKGGNDRIAGYTSSSREVIFALEALHGFVTAMGPGGLRALQIVGQGGQSTQWIGRSEGVPKSERLVSRTCVKSLEITIDGYKVIGLAICPDQRSRIQNSKTIARSIRRAALWFPGVPPQTFHLNEESFTGQSPLADGYQPISWIHFGGSHGQSLKHIVGLSVQYSHRLLGLRIMFDDAQNQKEALKLGRCRTRELPETPVFKINSKSGEQIDSVSVGMQRYQSQNGANLIEVRPLKSVKMTTNHGRVMEIGEASICTDMMRLQIAEGTTITGFYANHDPIYGLINLGIISELL
ncbi:hypothetical protein ABVK25_010045 [Lepraria finkii]|uniref:DUF7600 domain-containing protein n=1 Tax=Lepraria finkii TaxID=1340010 RepID=A0ABR4AVX2_9LECA